MDDLEGAATEALEEGRGLAAETEAALRVLTEASENATQARESVQAEWDKLAEEVSSLVAQIPPGQSWVAEATQQALDALGELGNGIEELRGESDADGQEALAATQGVGEQAAAAAPAATALGDQLEAAFEAISEQATVLAGSIGEALDGVHQFLGEDVPASVETMVSELRETGDALHAFLDETAAALEEAYATWESGLTEAEGVIEDLFGRLEDGLTQSVDEAVNRAASHYDQAWPELRARADRVQEELAALDVAVAQAGGDGAEAVSTMSDELRASATTLAAAHARLAEVRALLASYTFVSA